MQKYRAQAAARAIGWLVAGVVILGGVFATYRYVFRPKVVVTDVLRGPVIHAFYSTGAVQPRREFPVKSNLAGTLSQVLVDKGDTVKADQPLAVIDAPELEFAAAKAAAELKEKQQRADPVSSPVLGEFDARISSAGELIAIAKRELDRLNAAVASNAAAAADVDRAADRYQTFLSQRQALEAQKQAKVLELNRESVVAQAAVDTAQWNLAQRTLKSPTDGVVLDRPATVGTRLAINDHVLLVADVTPGNLVIRAQVDEEDKVMVREDQDVDITLYSFPDKAFHGTVSRIYDRAEPERRTFEVDVVIGAAPDALSAGMTGELAFLLQKTDDAVVVPSQAVDGDRVWVLESDRVKLQPVQIGIRSIERTQILSGLEAGERIVISSPAGLSDGTRVRATTIDPHLAAGLNRPAERGNFKGLTGG